MAGPVFVMALLSFLLGILLEKIKNKGLKLYVITGLILILAGQSLFLFLKGMWPILPSYPRCRGWPGMTPVNTLVTGSVAQRRGIITCLMAASDFGVAIGPFIRPFRKIRLNSTVLLISIIPLYH